MRKKLSIENYIKRLELLKSQMENEDNISVFNARKALYVPADDILDHAVKVWINYKLKELRSNLT